MTLRESACMNSAQTVRPTHDGVIDARTVVKRMIRLVRLLKHSPKKPVQDDPIKAWFNFELIFKGSYRIDEEYNKENNSKFSSFALNGDVATIIKSDIGCSYAIKDSILLKGQFGLYSDIKNRQTAVSFTIGCSLDLWNLCK